MAGVQLNTAGGNITIIGGGRGDSRIPLDFTLSDDEGGSSGGAQRLREREGLCVLSLGKSALVSLVRVKDKVEGQ